MILLVGVAGSGKSMQGRLLADELGYAWISTGELLRVLITGRRRQEMLEGKLLDDIEITNILDKILDLIDTSQEFVLDGFPRTIPQAEWLLSQAKNGRFDIDMVLDLQAPETTIRERLLQRGRQDDTEAAIALRMTEYQQVTQPIVALFSNAGIPVHTIDASLSPRAVHDAIMGYLKPAVY